MNEILAPWAAWYGKAPLKMQFPDSWEISVHPMKGGRDIGDAGIRQALQETIGAPRLSEFARGKSSAAILIDDLSRPTPSFRILPYIIEELATAGIPADAVNKFSAIGAGVKEAVEPFVGNNVFA